MSGEYERYVNINLPHSRNVILRIGRTLEFLEVGLPAAFEALENAAAPFDDDPAQEARRQWARAPLLWYHPGLPRNG